jgi:hypothetical protein
MPVSSGFGVEEICAVGDAAVSGDGAILCRDANDRRVMNRKHGAKARFMFQVRTEFHESVGRLGNDMLVQ